MLDTRQGTTITRGSTAAASRPVESGSVLPPSGPTRASPVRHAPSSRTRHAASHQLLRSDSPAFVSVIVPTANRPHLLAEALASIRRLEGPDLTFEIIVVDNRPSSTTEQIARSFGAVYLRESRLGPAAARNAGVRAARAEFIAFLDDDDLWTPDHIRPHLAELLSNPEVDAVVGQYVSTDTHRAPIADPFPPYQCEYFHIFHMFLNHMPQIGATVTRKSAFSLVGYFDESLRYGEDWDWHLRLALRAHVTFLPTSCVMFRCRPASPKQDTLIAKQLRYLTRHFWMNVLRAQRFGIDISFRKAFRTYCTHIGGHVRILLIHAHYYAQTCEYRLAARALLLACSVSPVHFVYYALTWPSIRGLLPLLLARVCLRDRPPPSLDRSG